MCHENTSYSVILSSDRNEQFLGRLYQILSQLLEDYNRKQDQQTQQTRQMFSSILLSSFGEPV